VEEIWRSGQQGLALDLEEIRAKTTASKSDRTSQSKQIV